ncbi:MFS transporter [Cyanobium sp. Morenito 9A2]|uniref:MFS transporter n=1 Tax=Cyanobium sp. Morenito 9A2 TaxID=2823718 RepID=UPI0020CFC5B1|nr:MFS transporter [Cyanobium sp. Morenito 9A2]MCP9850713.1 MFS transporter [Cyanobium sp. Morenito 9A2]
MIASVGAGGVLYLTPMVFHALHVSATGVGRGLAAAALAGTVGRFLSGWLLDRGLKGSVPVQLAALFSLLADTQLVLADGFGGYLRGQLLLGMAMGLYWPAIELAVAQCCGSFPSSRGYALARSADAAGIATGALLGALLAQLGQLRGIYLVDIICMVVLIAVLGLRPLPLAPPRAAAAGIAGAKRWWTPLLPMLGVTVLATAMPALLQSALPLDLLRGGLGRPAMGEQLGSLLIGLQLILLLALQWPVGRTLADRPVRFGLGLSLVCFALGNALLALSALGLASGAVLLLAQLPLALGEAAFLPTATEAVVELTPPEHQGLAMALFSQCFALSAFLAPLLAGQLLDSQGHAVGLWSLMGVLCLAGLPLVALLNPRRRNLV